MSGLTAERLRYLLQYDADTGEFTRLVATNYRVKPGEKCGNVDCLSGYVRIRIDGKRYQAHRLAWLVTFGNWPKAEIDHIDGDKTNNRLSNLREASHSQNMMNGRLPANNTSGHKGVSWHTKWKRWQATVKINGKQVLVGAFDSKEEAILARRSAESYFYGMYARAS